MSLNEWLTRQESRCPGCGFHPELQGCACEGRRLAAQGQARTSAAHPDDRAAVDAAIAQLAASGQPFSANDARPLHNVTGPVVGAAFQAAAKSGLIVRVGYEASTDPGTHAHPVATWRGSKAAAA
jgi:hypothetical protein